MVKTLGFIVVSSLSVGWSAASYADPGMKHKVENYLVLAPQGAPTAPAAEDYYAIDGDRFLVFSSKADKDQGFVEGEYFLERQPPASFTPNWSLPQPLKGLRVALDPGHMGGEWAELEVRIMKFTHVDDVVVKEGDLSFYVATAIQNRLKALGAEVLITRPDYSSSSLVVSFDRWLRDPLDVKVAMDRVAQEYSDIQNHPALEAELRVLKRVLEKGGPLEVHQFPQLFNRVYVRYDIFHRADMVNRFQPHLSFVIHFNSEALLNGRNAPTPENRNMAFVAGAITANELNDAARRAEFARLAVTQDFENSVELCEHLVRNLVTITRVPQRVSAPPELIDPKRYITYASVPTEAQFSQSRSTAVYSRNLILTRKIRGVLCYGESLYQDNEQEAYNLIAPNGWRLNQVVEAYVQSVFDYLAN